MASTLLSVDEIIFEENESDIDEDMDTLQNDYQEEILSKVDDRWMMSEEDEWNLLQSNAQNLPDMIDRLEGNIKHSFTNMLEKLTGLEKDDIEKTEKLIQNFKTRWHAKCKETENLRVSLKRATHESTRINDQYHEMEDSISKMRQQFGQAIDNSVTEIEELAICNNTLSETIQDLETKIIRGDKAYKQNARDNLTSLKQVIELAEKDDVNLKTLRTRLKKEADKVDRMIVVEDLFSVDKSSKLCSNLSGKSKQMIDAISQGLVETLKHELRECRNIIDTQRRQMKQLEREKEEFLQNQLALKNDGVHEMNEILEYLRRSVSQKKPSDDSHESGLNIVKRNFDGIKRLVNSLNDGLDASYKKCINKTSDISDLRDNIKELEDKIKLLSCQSDNLNEEKNFLKLKVEQGENQYRLASDELNTIQTRLKTLDEERKLLFNETVELKDGKVNIEDVCSNLSGENEKLGEKLKLMQRERDKVFTDLHEQIQRINQYSIENNELQHKCENFDNAISKLRREYQDQTREINIMSRENEELKTSFQDSEQERLKLRRSMKSVETGNKDLEDQIFQLTNENQRLKSEHSKVVKSKKENEEMIQEMQEKLQITDKDQKLLESQILDLQKERKEIENLHLKRSVQEEQGKSEKRTLLLNSFEKMIIKLLHQRKELLKVYKLDQHKDIRDASLTLSTSQSIDYKEAENIQNCVKTTADEIDKTYNILSENTQTLQLQHSRYKIFCNELASMLNSFDDSDKDSCYSTETDYEPALLLSRREDGKRGLSALKVNSKDESNHLPKLMEKIKKCLCKDDLQSQRNSNQNKVDLTEDTKIRKKLHAANKKIRQLNAKLRNRKSLEYNLRNKISNLKKEAKVFKEFHRSFHTKSNSPPHCPKKETPPGLQVNAEDPITQLRSAEEELKKVKTLLDEQVTDNYRHQVGDHLNLVDFYIREVSQSLNENKHSNMNNDKELDINCDELKGRFEALSDERQYMLDHLTFTNKRLEVLLGCLKGKDVPVDDNNNKVDSLMKSHTTYTRRVLKRVRETLKSDQEAMERAVSILELTKAISVTDLTELSENKALNEEHKEMIVLVKSMNDNMEYVLREARSNITDGKIKKISSSEPPKNDIGLNGSLDTPVASSETLTNGNVDPELVPRSELMKKENELKSSLENAQSKIECLSQYLQQRELELKERDKLIAKLNQEYETLKLKAKDTKDENILTRDRIIKEYAEAKKRLEKENEFLQMVVKEVREELLNFQKTFKKEEETQLHLQEFINELQLCKSSLEHSLDKMGYELNIVKKDRDHLIRTMHEMSMRNSYVNSYYGDSAMMNHHHAMYDGYQNGAYYPECNMCSYQDCSLSTTFPQSEEDWECTVSCTDDVDSLPSDGDQGDGVISSSESQKTTSSRVAKTIKTEEASEVIKAKNRPQRYLREETRTRKPLLSPKQPRSRSSTIPDSDPFDSLSLESTMTTGSTTVASVPGRVQGRREQGLKNGSSFRSSGRRSSHESPSISSSRKSPETRIRYSYPDAIRAYSPPEQRKIHNPVYDIDAAVNTAARTEKEYFESHVPLKSPRNTQLVTPFMTSSSDVLKKKKKKFLAFGKK